MLNGRLRTDVANKVLLHPVGNVVTVAERAKHPTRHQLALVFHIEPLQVFAAVHWSSFLQLK